MAKYGTAHAAGGQLKGVERNKEPGDGEAFDLLFFKASYEMK